MKKIIIFFIAIFSILNTSAQEECVEFDGAWVASYGVLSMFNNCHYGNDGYMYISGTYSGNSTSVGNITLPAPPSPWEGTYIAKFDTMGNCIWATHAIGQGSGRIGFTDVFIDDINNVYLIGSFNGTVNFQSNILNSSIGAASHFRDGFIARLNDLGQVQWVSIYKGILPIKIEADNTVSNFHIASWIYENNPAIIEQDTFYSKGEIDILLSKVNTQGQVQHNIHIGGNDADHINSISVDDNNNLYISGTTISDTTHFGLHTLINTLPNNKPRMYVAKINPQGSFEWALQSTAVNFNSSVGNAYHSLSKQGDIYVYGNFSDKVMYGSSMLSPTHIYNTYYASISNQGQVNHSAIVIESDTVHSVSSGAVDADDNLYLTGNFDGTNTFGDTILNAENYDIFVMKLKPESEKINYLWANQSTGQGYEISSKILIIKPNEVYISGGHNQGDAVFGELILPAPGTGYQQGFIAKISECEPSNINEPNPLAQISVYPNPAISQLTVTNLPANSTVSISDITGRVIYTQQAKHNTLHIPVKQWGSGMYFVKIKSGESVVNKKIVINLEK